MPEVSINVPISVPDLTSEVLGKAVMAALGQQGEAAIMKEAVRFLTTPDADGYQKGTSPLMRVFKNAITNIAEKLILERLTNDPELVSQVEQVYLAAIHDVLQGDGREKLVKRMSDKLHEAFRGY